MNIFDQLKKIKDKRYDLSNYLIHFTRNGKANSFETLKQIVLSGRINCGWSIRKHKRTIFGDFPAICFTDMPLYSFWRYVINRNDFSKVDFYGVAVFKESMFKLGARNVIYGTTNPGEDERQNNEVWFTPHLPEKEQYRYMLTDIGYTNDWTHEREWRWINHYEFSNGDYLPIWQNNFYVEHFGDSHFNHNSPIFLIVRYDEEVLELKTLFDTFSDPEIYNQANIKLTYAFSLERLQRENKLDFANLDFLSLVQHDICIAMHSS